ncbi:MAG: DC1 domain-containing protein [Candidatus Heimdallarchaeota archaeon]|nr:MAG: DC1 domain-containing protein [Candidatus Heimdallarchaeota archaeon]
MFGRKRQTWFTKAQMTNTPLKFREMAPKENPSVIAAFLRKKIGLNELNGFVSFDDEKFIPTRFLHQLISRELATKGFIDVCDIIDTTNLPGELLEHQIKLGAQNFEGFFDIIHRKFFTLQGAKSEIKQKLSTTTTIGLKYLLNQLYWTEEHLEGILELIAQDNQFIGYIDPIKQRIYNFTPLNFTSSSDMQKNIEYLIRFINTSFQLESEVSIYNISKLTQLSEEACLEFLKKHRNKINFIFSANYDYIYPTMDIMNQILKDIFVYRNIPIDFWIRRLDVDRPDFFKMLEVLNHSLKGTLSTEDFTAPSLSEWFENGIAVEDLASSLNLNPLRLLDRILKLAKLLGLRLITGETSDPFLVKGVRYFEIFCQVDTSSYTNPGLYFECQNCRRIMCSNCRSTGSKHECPFCGNISAFIIDLPRYCSHCRVNYTHSYNLVSTEECHFCKKGPLKVGWTEYEPVPLTPSELDPLLSEFFEKTSDTKIPLKQLINLINRSDSETIAILETYILNGKIQGKIKIKEMTLQLDIKEEKFLCGVCDLSKADLVNYVCTSCDLKLCTDCYNEMSTVGMIFCPECGGSLQENK